MSDERTRAGSRFWLHWVIASAAAWAAGSLLQLAVTSSVPESVRDTAVISATHSAIWGLVAGLLQWLILRRLLSRTGGWVLASSAGWGVAGAVSGALIADWGDNASGMVHIIGTGLATGLLQWLVMREQVERAGWWVPASTVLVPISLFAGAAATGLAELLMLGQPFGEGLQPGPLFAAVFGLVGGSVFGATSAGVLMWLLRRPGPLGVTRPARATTA